MTYRSKSEADVLLDWLEYLSNQRDIKAFGLKMLLGFAFYCYLSKKTEEYSGVLKEILLTCDSDMMLIRLPCTKQFSGVI